MRPPRPRRCVARAPVSSLHRPPMHEVPDTPLDHGHKTLPLRPGPRYNLDRSQASGSVQLVLPGGPAPAVVGLFYEGAAG